MPEDRRILIVDDDCEIVRGLSIRLRASGFQVSTASDGLSGLTAATESRPDAIVLDIRMPIMDGMTVLAKLRENVTTQSIPVVMLTANVAETIKSRALDLGAKFLLEKPYDPKTLIQAIERAIGGTTLQQTGANAETVT